MLAYVELRTRCPVFFIDGQDLLTRRRGPFPSLPHHTRRLTVDQRCNVVSGIPLTAKCNSSYRGRAARSEGNGFFKTVAFRGDGTRRSQLSGRKPLAARNAASESFAFRPLNVRLRKNPYARHRYSWFSSTCDTPFDPTWCGRGTIPLAGPALIQPAKAQRFEEIR